MKVYCNCKHEEQDKLNGKGIRTATPIEKKANLRQARCTVCLKEHDKLADNDTVRKYK